MNLKEDIVIGFVEKLQQHIGEDDEEFPSLLGGEPVSYSGNMRERIT